MSKLFKKRMWAVVHPQYLPSVHSSMATANYLLQKCGSRNLGRVIAVEVREIPKRKPRK